MAYFDKYGVEFSDDRKTLICCPKVFQGGYVIPDGVTSIEDFAFSDCTGLTSVTIPESVCNIGVLAFDGCESLPIEDSLQYADTYLVKAFNIDKPTYKIKEGTKWINQYAFDKCEELTSIFIPSSVSCILDNVLSGRSICSICVDQDNATYKTIDGVLFSKDGQELLYYPEGRKDKQYNIPKHVISIGTCAFADNKYLTTIIIPEGVKTIGDYAFSGCHKITSLAIPNSVTEIGVSAFLFLPNVIYSGIANGSPWEAKSMNGYVEDELVYKDSSKKELLACFPSVEGNKMVPNTVTRIGDWAFCDCAGLTSVNIPNSVTHIGTCAFRGCTGLKSIEIPDSVTEIAYNVFDCDLDLPVYNAHVFARLPRSYVGEYIIPDGIEAIAKEAFSGCEELTSINIPDSVSCIESDAFRGCTALTSIVIPKDAFGKDGTPISLSIISGCTSLRRILLPTHVSVDGSFCFKDLTELQEISIPEGVEKIPENCFRNCKNLKYLSLPDSVKKIGECAFYDCTSLEEITLPQHIKEIPDWCFRGCGNLKRLVIPDSVKKVGLKALSFCNSLTELTIPEGVEEINDYAIWQCNHLKSLTLSRSIQKLGKGALCDLLSLKEICIPKGQKARFLQMGLKEYEDIIVERDNEELTILLNLAKAYEFGIGVSQNIAQAVLIYTQAAAKGCAEAAYRLAEWYQNGEVLPLDLNKALDLYKQAAKSGNKDAEEKAQKIQQKIESEEKKQADYLAEKQKEQETKAVTEAQAIPYYLFFDTETAGLPPKGKYDVPVTNPDFWPRLVQLAWILTDKEGRVLNRKSKIIYPNGFSIPASATAVHHITTEHAMQVGEPLRDVLGEFIRDLLPAVKVVGHNIKFDRHIVGAELYSMDMDYLALMNKPSICTMTSKSIIDYCALPQLDPNKNGYKWPSLQELYRKLFNRDFEDAHDALADITATKDCFLELKRRGIIKE